MEVALGVDGEAVVAHGLTRRAGLEPGHVDAAGGELLEQLEQAAGAVDLLVQDDRCLVAAGARRDLAGSGHHDEPSDRGGDVADVLGERRQAVGRGSDRRADAGLVEHLARRAGVQFRGGRGGGQGLHEAGGRAVGADPTTDLGPGVGVGANRVNVAQGGPRPGGEDEGHRDEHLADDDERVTVGEIVQGRADPAFDRVLDRDDRVVDLTGADRGQGRVDGGERNVLDGRGALCCGVGVGGRCGSV